MKLHVFVLQVNGDITDQEEFESRKARRHPVARRLVDRFSASMQDRFADDPETKGKFQLSVDETGRYQVHWRQPNPLAAMCLVEAGGKPAAFGVFLYGFEPLHDAAAVDALQDMMVKLVAGSAIEPGFGLRQITQRPAIIMIPLRKDTEEHDQRAVSNILYCLGIAFFEQAAAFIDQIDRFFQSEGFTRVGPKPTWPRP